MNPPQINQNWEGGGRGRRAFLPGRKGGCCPEKTRGKLLWQKGGKKRKRQSLFTFSQGREEGKGGKASSTTRGRNRSFVSFVRAIPKEGE